MGRIGLALLIVGPILSWIGYKEWSTARTSTTDAVAVELATLEKGEKTDNYHLQIGEHMACYYGSVISYKTSKYGKKEVTESTTITHCFYPIISQSHPFFTDLAKQLGGLDKIPDGMVYPKIKQFTVLVKTHRFKTMGDIPKTGIRREPSVKGLVLNVIAPLGSKEKEVIKEDFPEIDFDKVLILEEGRQPGGAMSTLGMLIGGIVLALAGLGLIGAAMRSS